MKKRIRILAIETSCDETSLAVIERLGETGEGFVYKVLAHETISQINLHREFGGVYPTLSKREHEKNLIPLLHKVLKDSGLLFEKTQEETLESFDLNSLIGLDIELLERYPILKENTFDFFSKYKSFSIDFVAVTNGPGLPPALWVGVNFAKTISILMGSVPLYPINHMEGHIIGGVSERFGDTVNIVAIRYPAVCLLISGGHTELVLSKSSGSYQKIGETQDDACGEAYDKVARLLDLPYPGGPEISRLAKQGRELSLASLSFPRPMLHSKDLNFSFSGLKTHILYFIQNYLKVSNIDKLDGKIKLQIATEFEEAVRDVLINKTRSAIYKENALSLIVGGGVASNFYLKENFEKLAIELGAELHYSAKDLATDNALMIALTCATQIENGVLPTKIEDFKAIGSKNYEWK